MKKSSEFISPSDLDKASSEVVFDIPFIFAMKPRVKGLLPRAGVVINKSEYEKELAFLDEIFEILLGMEHKDLKFTDAAAGKFLGKIENTRRYLNHKLNEGEAKLWSRYIEFIQAYVHGLCFHNKDFLERFCAKEIPEDSLLRWFKVASNFMCLKVDGGFTNARLEALIEHYSHIKVDVLKKGALKIILAVLTQFKASEYLSPENLHRLMALLPEDAGLPYLIAAFAQQRLAFTIKNLIKNPAYFHAIDSAILKGDKPGFSFKTEIKLTKPESISGNKVELEIKLSDLRLLRFVSHFGTISFPIPHFDFSEMPARLADRANLAMLSDLKKAGFINSGRMIVKSKVFKEKDSDLDFAADSKLEFTTGFIEFYKKLIKKYSSIGDEEALNAKLDEFLADYKTIIDLRECIARFVPIDAIALFFRATSQPISVDQAVTMRATVGEVFDRLADINVLLRDCLSIAVAAQKIKNSKNSDPAKHDAWFRLAEKIVDKLWCEPKSLIVQTGTPITDKDFKKAADSGEEPHSAHAFYAVLKFDPTSSGFQILLVNGGPGLRRFHSKDPAMAESEYADPEYGYYKPVVSSLLAMNEENKLFLKHYLYRLMVLAYTPNVKGLMGNIYLSEAAFMGCGLYSATHVKAVDTDFVYAAQLSENCTIHNLKKALHLLLNLSDEEYYELEVLLLQLIDNLIEYLKPTATVSSAAAAGGAGASSGSGSLLDLDEEEFSTLKILDDFSPSPASFFSFEAQESLDKKVAPLAFCRTKLLV